MHKIRIDQFMAENKLAQSRSQAANLIKLGKVTLNGKVAAKAHHMVSKYDDISVEDDVFVSRAGNKLASVAEKLNLVFADKTVLDVGSSTGGFTDYALQNGAGRVIAVEVGTDQLHPKLRGNSKIELHEKTDIRSFDTEQKIDIVVIDVSFISLRDILPHVKTLCYKDTEIIAMVKPQFEAGERQKNKGVVKNDKIRRDILKDFEIWARELFLIIDKADSEVSGQKGNIERFYLLRPVS